MTDAKLVAFRESFPSTEFLNEHFSKNKKGVSFHMFDGRKKMITHVFHEELRRTIGHTLLDFQKYQLRANIRDREDIDLEPVYIFKDGKYSDFVKRILESEGLLQYLDKPKAESQLCKEFIYHYEIGAFYQKPWWRWCSEGGSIWTEVIPEALEAGLDRVKLEDLFKEFESTKYKM